MSDIEGVSFNEEPGLVQHRVLPPQKAKFSLVGMVMNMGIAKSEQGANTTLACLAVVMIIAAAGTYLWTSVPHLDPKVVAQEQAQLQHFQNQQVP